MATNGPAFQFYARDFIVGTLGMTPAEVGLYIRALAVSWDAGPLPADEAVLARMLMVPLPEFRKLWRVVGAKFEATEYGFVNRRLEHERGQQAAFREQQKAKGQASAKARWGNQTGNPKVTTVTPRLQPEGQPEGNSSNCTLLSASSEDQKQKTPRTKRAEPAEGFEEFWLAYPLKVAKVDALKAWNRIAPNLELRGRIHASLLWQAPDLTFEKDGKIKGTYPASWLNAERWNDEQPARAAVSRPPQLEPEVDWFEECKRIHNGECELNRSRHNQRIKTDAWVASQRASA